jgi:TRAP-type C4-dicarboxylate transport system permease small subunit
MPRPEFVKSLLVAALCFLLFLALIWGWNRANGFGAKASAQKRPARWYEWPLIVIGSLVALLFVSIGLLYLWGILRIIFHAPPG